MVVAVAVKAGVGGAVVVVGGIGDDDCDGDGFGYTNKLKRMTTQGNGKRCSFLLIFRWSTSKLLFIDQKILLHQISKNKFFFFWLTQMSKKDKIKIIKYSRNTIDMVLQKKKKKKKKQIIKKLKF